MQFEGCVADPLQTITAISPDLLNCVSDFFSSSGLDAPAHVIFLFETEHRRQRLSTHEKRKNAQHTYKHRHAAIGSDRSCSTFSAISEVHKHTCAERCQSPDAQELESEVQLASLSPISANVVGSQSKRTMLARGRINQRRDEVI